jgi:dTDP-4-dehydrorhamnose reductase
MTNQTLLFGATSILGYALARNFPERMLPFITPGCRAKSVRHWPMLKLDEREWLAVLFERCQPDVLLYCHAVCDVPKCEAAPDWAREINVEHVRRVITALPEQTKLVYISSDHVFGGDGVYDEAAPPCPISVYGRTRVDAEKLVVERPGSLVVRVGLAIGPSPNGRTGHWDWLRYRLGKTLPVTIVDDEYRSVVWADDLAERIMDLSESGEMGLRHIASTRVLSRIELADYLLSFTGMDATYNRESRYDRGSPHLGRVELATLHRGDLARPLPSVLDGSSAKMLTNSLAPSNSIYS